MHSASVRQATATPKVEFEDDAQGQAEYRTRWIYFMKFTWGSNLGRFMSLYYLSEGLNEAEIGAVFAAGSIAGPIFSTVVGVIADRVALRTPSARHWCFAGCIVLGTISFNLQALHIPHVSRFTVMLICRMVYYGANVALDDLSAAITVQCMKDRTRFGQERLYGAVSWAIMHLLLGVLIDRFGRVVQHVGVTLSSFVTLAVLISLGKPPALLESSPGKAPGLLALADNDALCALLRSYFTSVATLTFFIYAVTLGYGMTIVEHLIFLLFRELGASYFLCGVSVVVTVVFEIPLFALSQRMLAKAGAMGLLTAAGLCYSFRVVGYTLCPGGWYVLLFEPMHGVTIATHTTASVELVASITPAAFAATGQAFYGLVRSGVGSMLGSLVGGAIIRRYGESACYRSSAVVVLVGLTIYVAAWGFSRRRVSYQSVDEAAAGPRPPAIGKSPPAARWIGACSQEEGAKLEDTEPPGEEVPELD